MFFLIPIYSLKYLYLFKLLHVKSWPSLIGSVIINSPSIYISVITAYQNEIKRECAVNRYVIPRYDLILDAEWLHNLTGIV